MKILFDQGTPAPLRHALVGHSVKTAFEMGWSELVNGELLRRADDEFDLFITTDQNLRYQQTLPRKLAILVLATTSWPKLQRHTAAIAAVLAGLPPGGYVEFNPPDSPTDRAKG